ncbi:hypothetical protein Leryth_008788 [Lithospermum erythrorhizon]|nr:hypothetical protein Leryth_008788 [Lithospermum erythrorhizon]
MLCISYVKRSYHHQQQEYSYIDECRIITDPPSTKFIISINYRFYCGFPKCQQASNRDDSDNNQQLPPLLTPHQHHATTTIAPPKHV